MIAKREILEQATYANLQVKIYGLTIKIDELKFLESGRNYPVYCSAGRLGKPLDRRVGEALRLKKLQLFQRSQTG